MLTFDRQGHNAPINKGGRRTDSAAFCFLDTDFIKDYRDEAHLSTEQSCTRTPSRFSPADVNRQRSQHPERSPCPWPQKTVCLIQAVTGAHVMPPYKVIVKRADFLAANRGRRYATPGFVLLVQDRRDDDPTKRLGITISKKVGNAVIRNRMRRRFRALARELLVQTGRAGADHILIGRSDGIERDFATLRCDMQRALDRSAS